MIIKMSDGKVFYQKKCKITQEMYSVEVTLLEFVRLRTRK